MKIQPQTVPVLLMLLLTRLRTLHAADAPLTFADPKPQRYELTARASEIDSRARPHPEIDFVFEKDSKPADVEHASVDTRVPPQGKLVIWLMGYSAPLFERVNNYGLHAIQVHYANGWFAQFGKHGRRCPPPRRRTVSSASVTCSMTAGKEITIAARGNC